MDTIEKISNKVLEKSRNLWQHPYHENACVIVDDLGNGWVRVADLDAATRFRCKLDELTVMKRPSEPEDYEYSWTSDCAYDIYEDARERAEAARSKR
jgi:hypothetical protein